MRLALIAACSLFLVAGAASAQSDRGTITGTIADPAGAVIPGATIEAKNSETGALYRVASTATGNYTLAQLPAGVYQLSVSAQGFKQYLRTGITVLVAQTLRIDIALEVGSISETVTVNADAPLLRTEGGDLSHNVSAERLDDLPILSITGGIRDPYAVTKLIPGSYSTSGSLVRLSGTPTNTQTMRLEGQDSTNGWGSNYQTMTQPSVDAIEEFAVQTSNFAAEYGQAGSGVFNLTMKSGTNKLHGSAYEYFSNEALNAKRAFTNDRPRNRQNDFGFTLGGPVWIPGLYDGHDKTFFFFNFEQFRRTRTQSNPTTVPTQAFRNGDFSSILTGRNLCPTANPNCAIDTQGNAVPIWENAIYDPATETIINGKRVRDPFKDNKIPIDRFDPVAAKIQALIPDPTNSSRINNFVPNTTYPTSNTIPAVKIDHSFSPKIKVSGYWSLTKNDSRLVDGLPLPVTTDRQNIQRTHTVRLNYDHTITPTMLLHLGTGILHFYFNDNVLDTNFDNFKELGLAGTYVTRFPTLQGLSAPQGGMANMGPMAQNIINYLKTTATASVTWVRGNHTYKAGGEMRLDGFPSENNWPANGQLIFNAIESGLPSTEGQNLFGGKVGFPYASFLLGGVNNGAIGQVTSFRMGKNAWDVFIQDTWKVTRKFTLDYGIRWDYQTYMKEQYGRVPSISRDVLNPDIGLPGGAFFEATCNCNFANNYPYALGPRLGAAYQITSNTVLRAGWGISYGQTAQNDFWSARLGSNVPFQAPAYGTPAMVLKDGVPIQPIWPDFNPGQFPADPSKPSYFLLMVDRNAGRPPRTIMWSIGLQHQISTNLALDATYLGNRGVWWQSSLIDINRLTPQILAQNGLDINKAEDRQLLNSTLDSPLAASRGFNILPYPQFPTSLTVSQSLRPYPQFTNINDLWAPIGNTWFDALQVKVTKRASHGLDLMAAFSWQKELGIGAEAENNYAPGSILGAANNLLDRQSNKYLSGYSQPFTLVIAGNYRIPALNANKVLSYALRDWTFGAVLNYASGLPIRVPYANNQLGTLLKLCAPITVAPIQGGCQGTGTFANRVPGEPLYTADLNDSSVDPNKTFFLNPKAWVDPPAGQFGTSAAYYSDYRYQRRPSENMSLGRIFRLGEKASLSIRVELTNVFNRTGKGNPSATNAGATQVTNSAGKPTSGYGYINTGSLSVQPRAGQLVARIQF